LAKTAYYGAGRVPSVWVTVLVAGLLILLPALFCGGIMFMASKPSPDTEAGAKPKQPAH